MLNDMSELKWCGYYLDWFVSFFKFMFSFIMGSRVFILKRYIEKEFRVFYKHCFISLLSSNLLVINISSSCHISLITGTWLLILEVFFYQIFQRFNCLHNHVKFHGGGISQHLHFLLLLVQYLLSYKTCAGVIDVSYEALKYNHNNGVVNLLT